MVDRQRNGSKRKRKLRFFTCESRHARTRYVWGHWRAGGGTWGASINHIMPKRPAIRRFRPTHPSSSKPPSLLRPPVRPMRRPKRDAGVAFKGCEMGSINARNSISPANPAPCSGPVRVQGLTVSCHSTHRQWGSVHQQSPAPAPIVCLAASTGMQTAYPGSGRDKEVVAPWVDM